MTTTTATDFEPAYSPWRHGGWYVDNVRYPSGAVGCVSRNYPDGKWRIVCDSRPDAYELHTYPSRDAAARAEHELAQGQADASCEYREVPDSRYPHLVWPQGTCGWQGAGARRPELASIAHAQHCLKDHAA